tara:strand:+ start:265 stop:576 length:312 start_codon:yes stop_codon:yes gene_type:complete
MAFKMKNTAYYKKKMEETEMASPHVMHSHLKSHEEGHEEGRWSRFKNWVSDKMPQTDQHPKDYMDAGYSVNPDGSEGEWRGRGPDPRKMEEFLKKERMKQENK